MISFLRKIPALRRNLATCSDCLESFGRRGARLFGGRSYCSRCVGRHVILNPRRGAVRIMNSDDTEWFIVATNGDMLTLMRGGEDAPITIHRRAVWQPRGV